MAADTNYWLIWFIYLAASGVFYAVFWILTAFKSAKWLSYSFRAVAAAIILTPWYANVQGESFAPALMVMTLDLITIGASAVSRAAIPLMLAIIAAEIAVTLFYFIEKRRFATRQSKNKT